MDDRLTVDDVIRAGGCPLGIRRWFRARADELPPGFDMVRFLKEGMPLEMAKSLNDPFIERALALKHGGHDGW